MNDKILFNSIVFACLMGILAYSYLLYTVNSDKKKKKRHQKNGKGVNLLIVLLVAFITGLVAYYVLNEKSTEIIETIPTVAQNTMNTIPANIMNVNPMETIPAKINMQGGGNNISKGISIPTFIPTIPNQLRF